VNDKWRVDSHMRNRPGRIFYLLDFKGLDQVFIREYCEDNLNNKQYIDQICSLTSLFGEFNFDMLKALVEEMNRYNETPTEALEMLNAKPEYDEGAKYEIKLIDGGKEIKTLSPDFWRGNPLAVKGVNVEYDPDPEDDDSNWVDLRFTPEHLINLNSQEGKFIFESKGCTIIVPLHSDINFAFDVDGTLTLNRQRIVPSFAECLQELSVISVVVFAVGFLIKTHAIDEVIK
jgi:hypothetical protein